MIIILFILLLYISLTKKIFRDLNELHQIKLIINAKGVIQVLNSNFYTLPSSILVNNINTTMVNRKLNLTSPSNTIIMNWNSPVTDCSKMFNELIYINSIDLSNFNSPNIVSMSYMFYNCQNLMHINFTNFKTSNVRDMNYTFYNCIALASLDLSSFDTTKVISMDYMFFNCLNLTSLKLGTFKNTLTIRMRGIFQNCINLSSLDLSNFYIPKAEVLWDMFNGCKSLISLNLSTFDTTKVTDMDLMFAGCSSLISLNLKHFSTSSLQYHSNIFSGINPNIVFCIYTTSNYISSQILSYFKNNCSDLCFKIPKPKITKAKSGCIENCLLDIENPYEYNNICYENCPLGTYISLTDNYSCIDSCNIYNYNKTKCIEKIPEGYYINDYTLRTIEKCNIKCKDCSLESILNNNLCIYCNTEEKYFPIFNESKINYSFIECLNQTPEGFFFNFIENSYQPCYKTCKQCIWSGDIKNNNCTMCLDSDYQLIGNNCLEICNYYYYLDRVNNNYICSMECPPNFPYLKLKNMCVDECSLAELFKKECEMKTDNEIIEDDDILLTIKNALKTGSLDDILSSVIEGKEDLVLETANIIYQIISSNNTSNDKKNISIISLGECENILKSHYNISEEQSLIIFKIDVYEEGLLVPSINYEVYNSETKDQLDLSVCGDANINIYLPAYIEENNIYKYNPSDEYYNDECNTFTTEDGTDITTTDRKIEYINNNMSLCETNCKYRGYNSIIKKSKCECKVKEEEISLISEILRNKDKILNDFPDLKNATNLKILKCYKILFTITGLKSNLGSYILLFIILVILTCLILFIIKEFKIIINLIDEIVRIKSKMEKEKYNMKENNKKMNKKNKNKKNIKKDDKTKKSLTKNNPPKLLKDKKNKSKPSKEKNNNNLKTSGENTDIKSNSRILVKERKLNLIKKEKYSKNIFKYFNDYELNNLIYKEALKTDKRNYFQYYLALIKRKQIMIFAFYTRNDYNSRCIKICLFFFSFALSYSVNALFFTDATMHKIYVDHGMFNFIYLLPQIIYSSIITSLINIVVTSLSLSEKNILELKRTNEDVNKKEKEIKKFLKIKYIIFFILMIIFLVFFWYYVSCFGAVYKNTQIYLIKDISITFTLSLIYPFVICLLPGIFRIFSLKSKKKNKECIYKLSQIIQLIV